MLSPLELSDHVEIGQVLQRYGRALDAKRYDQLALVFADDAEIDYRIGANVMLQGTWREHRDRFPRFLDVFAYTAHLISPAFVELDGDRACAETKLVAVHGFETLAGATGTWTVFGAYDDALARTPDGWRVRRRRFVGFGEQGAIPPRAELRRYAAATPI